LIKIRERMRDKNLCQHYRLETDTCKSGCYDEKVFRNSVCPYSESSEEQMYCACYDRMAPLGRTATGRKKL